MDGSYIKYIWKYPLGDRHLIKELMWTFDMVYVTRNNSGQFQLYVFYSHFCLNA